LSDLLQPGAALRGAGTFAGNISGEGERYNLKGTIKSDALAADRVRLQGLSVTANGSGEGKSYKVNGNAVAQLLTAGDFQLNSGQLAGNVMGTGSDFRWIGELRALAAKGYGTTIAGLILHDARAELENGVLTASARQPTAGAIHSAGAKVHNLSASTLRVRNDKGATAGSVAQIKVGQVDAAQGQVKSIGVNGIDFTDKNGVTSVSIKDLLVGGFVSEQAEVGTFNIAGVRLSIRSGKIEGSTNDITPGTVKLADGQVENVRLAKPVFVVEPSGRYRASAALSVGGGVLGQINMGAARAAVVATGSEIQLNNFAAEVFGGHADGNARIALNRTAASQVSANFQGLDVAAPITVFAGAAVP